MVKNQASSQWRTVLSRLVRAEMVKRGIAYAELSERLKQRNINQSEANLRNKISKGIMGGDLLLQILLVMEVSTLRVDDIENMLKDVVN